MAFGKALIQNTINRLLNTIALFGITIFITRMIGASDFGVLTLMIANASLLNLVSSLGISSGIIYNQAAKNLPENKILTITFFLLLTQLFISSFFDYGWFLVNNSFWLIKGSNHIHFLLGICFFISISVIEKYNALFYGRQKYLLANNIVLMGNLILLFLLILISLQKPEDNLVIFVAYVFCTSLQAIILMCAYHMIYKGCLHIKKIDKDEFKSFFSYSILAFITNVLQFLAYRIDYWMVDYFKGSTQLGLYSVSVRLAQLFWIIPNLFAAIIFPIVAGEHSERNTQNLSSLIRIMNTFNIFSGILLFIFIPYLIILIFGSEYVNSVIPFQILLPGVISFCITTVLASYFAGVNKLMANFGGTIICLFAILFLDFILIPVIGIKGAAIASSTGYALSTIYSLIIFKRLTKISFYNLLIMKEVDLLTLKILFRIKEKV